MSFHSQMSVFRPVAALIRWRPGNVIHARKPDFRGEKDGRLYFEEFPSASIRDPWTHRHGNDNVLYSAHHERAAAAFDEEFASKTEFGQRIVNSLFTLGFDDRHHVNDTTLGTTVATSA